MAHAVVGRAIELTELLRSELTILSVVSSDPMVKTSRGDEEQKLTGFHRELIFKHFPKNAVKVEANSTQGTLYRCGPGGELRIQSRIEHGDPVDRICKYAEEVDAYLVIMGNRGLGNIGTLVLGSVSEKVVRKCSRSVMVVKDVASGDSDWERMSGAQRTSQRFTG